MYMLKKLSFNSLLISKNVRLKIIDVINRSVIKHSISNTDIFDIG